MRSDFPKRVTANALPSIDDAVVHGPITSTKLRCKPCYVDCIELLTAKLAVDQADVCGCSMSRANPCEHGSSYSTAKFTLVKFRFQQLPPDIAGSLHRLFELNIIQASIYDSHDRSKKSTTSTVYPGSQEW